MTYKIGFSQYLRAFFVGHLARFQTAHNLPNLPTKNRVNPRK